MVSTSLLTKDKFEYLELPTQIGSSEDFPVNHALVHIAQAVAETLKHAYFAQVECSNGSQTVSIRAIELEYRHLMLIEPLFPRELEVLQLIVESDKNPIIAQKLYGTEGAVKTYVRNIFAYRKAAAELALNRTLAFLKQHLSRDVAQGVTV